MYIHISPYYVVFTWDQTVIRVSSVNKKKKKKNWGVGIRWYRGALTPHWMKPWLAAVSFLVTLINIPQNMAQPIKLW